MAAMKMNSVIFYAHTPCPSGAQKNKYLLRFCPDYIFCKYRRIKDIALIRDLLTPFFNNCQTYGKIILAVRLFMGYSRRPICFVKVYNNITNSVIIGPYSHPC
jgi:hypothetical protein